MKKSIIALAIMVLFVMDYYGQQPVAQQPDLPIDAATKTQIINDLTKELNESYVFAETAKKMETDVKQRLQNKEYDKITSSREFAAKLTEDLQA